MKSLMENTVAKISAAILLAVFLTITVFSSAGIVFLGIGAGIYDTSLEAYEKQIIKNDIYYAANDFSNDKLISTEKGVTVVDHDYGREAGYRFEVKDSEDKVIYSDYDGKQECLTIVRDYQPWDGCTIDIYAVKNPESGSREALLLSFAEKTYRGKYVIAAASMAGLIIDIFLFLFLMFGAGRRREDNEVHLRGIDRRFADIYTVIAWGIIIALGACGIAAFDEAGMTAGLLTTILIGFVMSLIFIAWAMSMSVQSKNHTLLKNSLLGYAFRVTAGILKGIPSVWKTMAVAGIILLLNIVLFGAGSPEPGLAFLFIAEAIIIFLFIAYSSMNIGILNKAAERLAAGRIGEKIDVRNMFGGFKRHGENLNSIDEAVALAVNEQMKSEKMKTELITNVSHDIKTPLTSIINYSELLKKELDGRDDDNAREYADVVYEQSLRLKKLASDIVEYSKINTGNLKVEPRMLDLGMLVSQGIGEYEEKLRENGLTPVVNNGEGHFIYADGRHMWRILDNILGNILKYAQPGTRVYIDLLEEDGKVKAVFKNVSKYELNISADELMERFVRGDASRKTEGSGLGLSIASELAKIQGGEMMLSIDGDLFKTVVVFENYVDQLE